MPGKFEHSPFSIDIERDARAAFLELLSKNGARPGIEQTTPGQPYLLHAIGEAVRLMGDPDASIIHGKANSFVNGVRNGYGAKLHRAPAIFHRKSRWRRYDEYVTAELQMPNSKAADCNMEALMHQLRDEEN